MLKYPFILLFVFWLASLSLQAETNSQKGDSLLAEEWKSYELGDINSDGIVDSAFVFTPAIKVYIDTADGGQSRPFGCENDSCYNIVRFSCKLPDLFHNNSVWGRVVPLGHLSNGKVSDLLFVPDWFQSCWSSVYVYQLKNNKWNCVAQAGTYICLDEKKEYIVKTKNGYYLRGQKFNKNFEKIIDYKVKIKWK